MSASGGSILVDRMIQGKKIEFAKRSRTHHNQLETRNDRCIHNDVCYQLCLLHFKTRKGPPYPYARRKRRLKWSVVLQSACMGSRFNINLFK